MSDRLDGPLRPLFALGQPEAPGPSERLLAEMGAIKPVSTRVPWRMLVLVAVAACVYPLYAFAVYPLRVDLHALPPAWVVGVGLLWLAGFVVPLVITFLPSSGQVLPNSARAGRAAFLAASTLILMGLFFTVDAPGETVLPKTTWAGFFPLWWHCVSFGLKITIPTLILAAFGLRRIAIVKPWRLGAAVGAASGAAAGLTLHGLCPYGGAAHVGLAHGGGVAIGAIIGGLWLPLVARFRSDAISRTK
jgi:hypothetical protein